MPEYEFDRLRLIANLETVLASHSVSHSQLADILKTSLQNVEKFLDPEGTEIIDTAQMIDFADYFSVTMDSLVVGCLVAK